MKDATGFFIPAHFQPVLPASLIARGLQPPGVEEVEQDVVFVGAGPAGLAGAIELARIAAREPDGPLAGLRIAVLEKAASLGEHSLSGAVVNPASLQSLFPDLDLRDLPLRQAVTSERLYWLTACRTLRLPLPPPMRNGGNFTASICEIVRWLGTRAEELGAAILTGCAATSLLMRENRVCGVRTAPSGLDRNGAPGPSFQPATDITGRITVLAEGTRGALTQAYLEDQSLSGNNPQIYGLGVKELWRVRTPLKGIIHTVGWPLPRGVFGGSFCYPMSEDLVSLGLVVGLDYRQALLDPHGLLQRLKTHPLFRSLLAGGELLEWGAKTIPEGGWHSLPRRLHGDGMILVGDAAGLVNVAALKGIHYAIHSGVLAARAIADALRGGEASAADLGRYDALLRESFVFDDLKRTRNIRLGFQKGSFAGIAVAGLSWLSGGRWPRRAVRIHSDAMMPRDVGADHPTATPDGALTFSKQDANFRSGNSTRDDIPLHVAAATDVPAEVARFYAALCPAAVYEVDEDGLHINAPNCIDCKATDILGPRWMAREGGSGPRYQQM